MNISNTPPCVAAILTDHPLALHDTLASFALTLCERGRGVRGILATSRRLANGGDVPALVDQDSRRTYLPASRQAATRDDTAAPPAPCCATLSTGAPILPSSPASPQPRRPGVATPRHLTP